MSYKILELPYSKDTLEQYLNKNYTFLGFIGDKMIFKYKEVTSRQLTNKTNTEKFFELNDEWINNYAKAISERLELDFEFTKEEIVKFIKYRTEWKENGKKVKWQKQQTFEVPLRLQTWFWNIKSKRKSENIILTDNF